MVSGRSLTLATAAVATLLTGACERKNPTDVQVLASIVISPNPQTLAVNATQQFTAVGTDTDGNTMVLTPTWSVVAGGGAINGTTGMFTAGTVAGPFANTIRVTHGSMSATATVNVTAGPLATLSVTPTPVSLAVGAGQQFVATGRDAFGNTVVLTTPTWSIMAGGGTVNGTGMFTAGSVVGSFANTIQATSGGISGRGTINVTAGPLATIVVSPNPSTLNFGAGQTFTAVGRDAGGNAVAITPTWSIINGGGAINATTGAFTAGSVSGSFANTVRATSGTISGTATVNVTSPLASITITPNPASVVSGAAQQFTAVGRNSTGDIVAITPAWSIVNGGGNINASSGLFTAGAVLGTYQNTVSATSDGITATATVIVTSPAVATITVTPNPVSVESGRAQQFTAVGRDAGGNVVAITPVWSVVNGGGTINAGNGVFTGGIAAGTYANTIQATSGGISGNATVTVVAVPLASITVTPNPASVAAGAGQQFTATGRDTNGNAMAISPVWAVVNGGGNINTTGVFVAGSTPGTYANTVRASSGGISGTATVVVTTGSLATIVVSPNPAGMAAGGTQQFTAVGFDGSGNVVAITPTWAVVNSGGTIDAATGLFTAGAVPGTFTNTVRATSGSVSGHATVSIAAGPLGPVATIVVSPNPVTLNPGVSQLFTAIGRDAGGNIVPITPVWAVVNNGGTINPITGLFTAGALPGTFTNTVQATSGAVSGTASVNVTAPPMVQPSINLGSAALNGIMAGQAFTCVIGGIINADIAVSPGNTVTGFPPCVITGTQHLNDGPAIQAQVDLTAAYNQLAGLPCPPANFIVANLGGTTKPAGVYCSASSIGVTGVLTLDGGGDPNAVFVFQAGSTLTTAGDIVLINQAQAKNVYWLVGSSATIGTGSQWKGNIIALTSIGLVDNAMLIGRALARNGSVTLTIGNVIILP